MRSFAWCVLFVAVIQAPAEAARPFVTDDARMTAAGSCQLESWTRFYDDNTEVWALPACNPTGNLELTFGGGQARYQETSLSTSDPGPNLHGNTYIYFPLSMSFADDRVVAHLNAGWLHDKSLSRERFTWGIGSEINATPRLMVVAESFGDDRDRPYWQTGVRYAIVPNLFQVDATVGTQSGMGNAHRWFSFGVRYTPASLF